jgi:catechol 2,3-dioxygenase-like lactoylglutathione lyase family enzyme
VHPQLLRRPCSKAVGINHVSVRVPDIHRTSQFDQEFFGMPLRQQSATALFSMSEIPFLVLSKPGGTIATVDHFDFGIANFNPMTCARS